MSTLRMPMPSAGSYTDLRTDLKRARTLATLLDSKFGFLGFRFGLDPIIGLIPVVGDTIGVAAGLFLVHVAQKHQLGNGVIAKMLLNLGIEWGGGLIPGVGELFDASFKANLRNLALLEAAAAERGVRV